MIFKELIDSISESTQLKKTEVKSVLEQASQTIIEKLSNNEEVVFSKLGKFKPVVKEPSTARNPRTGDVINLPKRLSCKFTFGKACKDELKAVEVE